MAKQTLYLTFGVALLACGATAFRSRKLAAKWADGAINDTSPEIVGGAAHECYRECVEGDNRVCKYEFHLVEYSTMAAACSDCPYNATDCYKKGCITAGGEPREVTVVNHMLPGPSVQVCRGDIIRVQLYNDLASGSGTIHWHGMYQKDTPYMDGVPYVTQCPIPPGNAFTYNFTADPVGTHIWHSHVGIQEPDGFFGSLVVRGPNDPLRKYYDHDLAEHVITVWHWYGSPTTSVTTSTFFRSITAIGHSLIVNGYTSTLNYTRDGRNYTTPRANFIVEKGQRYRFRTIANTAIYCPVQISVAQHKLTIIATDGIPVEPVEVDSFIINAGERYDFVLNADQDTKTYVIAFRGLGNCATNQTFSSGTIRYANATDADLSRTVTYADTNRTGVLLNPIGAIGDLPNTTHIMVADLKSTYDEADDVSGKPDQIIYWTFALNIYNQSETEGPYAQIDRVSFDFPPVPFLTQYREVTDDMYCGYNNASNADCYEEYCNCPVINYIKLGSLVEIVMHDATDIASVTHPIHIHGGHFRVVYMETGNGSTTLADFKERNENGSISKTFDTAPLKDVVGVPSLGYAVIRLRAKNPGYWYVHCHVAVHQEEGMATVMKVGEDSDMVHPPANFPRCGDYDITSTSSYLESSADETCSSVQSDETSETTTEATTKATTEAIMSRTLTDSSEKQSRNVATKEEAAEEEEEEDEECEEEEEEEEVEEEVTTKATIYISPAKAHHAAVVAERQKRREIIRAAKDAIRALREKRRRQ